MNNNFNLKQFLAEGRLLKEDTQSSFKQLIDSIPNKKYFPVLDDEYEEFVRYDTNDDIDESDVVDLLYYPIFDNELKGKPGIEGDNFNDWVKIDRKKNQGVNERILVNKILNIISDYTKSNSGNSLKEATQIAFGDYSKIYSDIAKSGDLEAARQAVIDALPDDVSLYPLFNLTPEEEKEKYADMVADTFRTNQPDFTGEGEEGYWNGWELGYAEDNIFFITPANSKRPWIDGRVRKNIAIVDAEANDPKAVKFLQDLGKQLGATPQPGPYNNIELKVQEQDLQNLFNF